MDNKLNLSKEELQFLLSIAIAIPLVILSGIIIGLIKMSFRFETIVLFVGFISALIYRRVAKGFQMKIAVASILTALLGLIVVECVTNFGVEGLLVFRNYGTLFTFVIQEDINRVSWTVARLLSLSIAFSYSRVVQ